MKGWIGGLVVGVVLGGAVIGATQGGAAQRKMWQSAEIILQSGDHPELKKLFQAGYIEGMADTLAVIEIFHTIATSLPNFRAVVQKQTTCFRSHGQGTTEEFLRWATGVWQARIDKGDGGVPAAGALFSDACK